jgi:hypothetical protein
MNLSRSIFSQERVRGGGEVGWGRACGVLVVWCVPRTTGKVPYIHTYINVTLRTVHNFSHGTIKIFLVDN